MWGHAGQVGGSGMPPPPPRPHRRIQGSWDPEADLGGPGGDTSTAECRAAADVIDGGPADPCRRRQRPGPVPRAVDGELANDADERRDVARIIRTAAADACAWATIRGAGTGSIPTTVPPASSPSTPLVAARDPHFFPELGLAPHRPERPAPVRGRPAQPRRGRRGLRGVEDRRPPLPPEPVGVDDGDRSTEMRAAGQARGRGASGQAPAGHHGAFAAKVRTAAGRSRLTGRSPSGEAFHSITEL